ncbi:MAG TPA: AI-2E family transporter [Candidatus Nanoarchaeia archaeon]|nr:AI-2E family transporter [Candidatus Nanoarchaeia archaeon]
MELKRNYKLYAFVAFLFIIVALFLYVISPFLKAILVAIFLYVLTLPVFIFLRRFVPNDTLASLLMCIAVLAVIFIPILFLLGEIVDQAIDVSVTVSKNFQYIISLPEQCTGNASRTCEVVRGLENFIGRLDIEKYAPRLQEIGGYILEKSTSLVIGFTSAMIDIFAMIVTLFFLYRDGISFARRADRLVPLQRDYWDAIKRQIHDIVQGMLYGSFVTALIEGAIGAFLFWIFGLNNPLFWGAIMAALAFIPMVGGALVYVSFSLTMIVSGRAVAGILFLILQAAHVIYIENFLKPRMIGEKVGVHSLIMFFSFFGGIVVFGPIGIIIGPLMAALLVAFLRIYSVEFG